LWAHPDLLPDADDLDDPAGFADRAGATHLPALDASTGTDDRSAPDTGTSAPDTGGSDPDEDQ
jgi:hypothetical protein